MFCGGSKSAKGGPNPLADMDRGGPNPLADLDRGGVQIRGGSKSAVTGDSGSAEKLWWSSHFFSAASVVEVRVGTPFSPEFFRPFSLLLKQRWRTAMIL